MSKELAKTQTTAVGGVFDGAHSFDDWQRLAKALSSSDLVPARYRGPQGMGNCLVALELSYRLGESPFMIMQNMTPVEGTPAWSSAFCGHKLTQKGYEIGYETEDLGKKSVEYQYWTGPKGQRVQKTAKVDIQDQRCRVVATNSNGEVLYGPWVSIEMAVKDGWYTRPGSKWPHMADVMLHYRAVSFFQRRYEPGILIGGRTVDEVEDIAYTEIPDDEWNTPVSAVETINQQVQEDDEQEGEEYEGEDEYEGTKPEQSEDDELI